MLINFSSFVKFSVPSVCLQYMSLMAELGQGPRPPTAGTAAGGGVMGARPLIHQHQSQASIACCSYSFTIYRRHRCIGSLGRSIGPCQHLMALNYRSAGEALEFRWICSSHLLHGLSGLHFHEWRPQRRLDV